MPKVERVVTLISVLLLMVNVTTSTDSSGSSAVDGNTNSTDSAAPSSEKPPGSSATTTPHPAGRSSRVKSWDFDPYGASSDDSGSASNPPASSGDSATAALAPSNSNNTLSESQHASITQKDVSISSPVNNNTSMTNATSLPAKDPASQTSGTAGSLASSNSTSSASKLSDDPSITPNLSSEKPSETNSTDPSSQINKADAKSSTSAASKTTALDDTSGSSEALGRSSESDGNVRTFVLSQSMNWSEEDLNIYDTAGPVAYVITNKASGVTLTHQDIIVKSGPTGQTKLRVDAYPGTCGKSTDWFADNMTKISLNPRGWLADHWTIKNPTFPKYQYIFMRRPLSVQGNIIESGSKRRVAKIEKKRISSAIPNLPFKSGDKVYIVTNDGYIPDWDLLTMLALATQHHKYCPY
ncbi:hypothetical protein CROQUDRAFT_674221 [Cronartium quercuum f. sp. fusiforme G11]|uniref:Uncharacterized protein n=1 Tax=Cronartium quercuum f. sp. fusiforme G11 TaxID=708437 RepID=A0A9P6NBK5_9BASI|nr:hypothetical protein CROQUDRAFT_674221 [Cronartium quercuum f. sp. fusiforme G11]